MSFNSRQMTARLASAGTIWAVNELLKTRKGRKVARTVDKKVSTVQRKAGKGVRNARSNRGYLAAGLGALAVSAALLARAMTD